MITTLTLDPQIERNIILNELKVNERNEADYIQESFYASGIQICKGLSNFQIQSTSLSINYTKTKGFTEWLTQNPFSSLHFNCNGKMPTQINLYDQKNLSITEIFSHEDSSLTIEAPPFNLIENLLLNSNLLILSGTISYQISEDYYKNLISICKVKYPNLKIILQSKGLPLKYGIQSGPHFIISSKESLSKTFQKSFLNYEEIVCFCQNLCNENDIDFISVTIGTQSILVCSKKDAYYANFPNFTIESTKFIEEAVTIGVCRAILENQPLPYLLQYAVASASATMMQSTNGLMVTEKDFETFFSKIRINEIK